MLFMVSLSQKMTETCIVLDLLESIVVFFFLLTMICVPEVPDQGMWGGMTAVHKFPSANLSMRLLFREVIQLSTLGRKRTSL